MSYHIKNHHIHLLEARCRRVAKALAAATPNVPPAQPSLLALLAVTKHQPQEEV